MRRLGAPSSGWQVVTAPGQGSIYRLAGSHDSQLLATPPRLSLAKTPPNSTATPAPTTAAATAPPALTVHGLKTLLQRVWLNSQAVSEHMIPIRHLAKHLHGKDVDMVTVLVAELLPQLGVLLQRMRERVSGSIAGKHLQPHKAAKHAAAVLRVLGVAEVQAELQGPQQVHELATAVQEAQQEFEAMASGMAATATPDRVQQQQQQLQQLASSSRTAVKSPRQQQQLGSQDPAAAEDHQRQQMDQQHLEQLQEELQEQLRLLEQLLSPSSASMVPTGAPATPPGPEAPRSSLAAAATAGAGVGTMGFEGAQTHQAHLQRLGGLEAAAPAWQRPPYLDAVTGPGLSAQRAVTRPGSAQHAVTGPGLSAQHPHTAQSQQSEGDAAAAAIAAAMAAAAAAQHAAAGSIIDAVAPSTAAPVAAAVAASQASTPAGEEQEHTAGGLTVSRLEWELHASGKASIAIRRISTTLVRLAHLVHGPKADPSPVQVAELLLQWPLLHADILQRLQPGAREHIKLATAQTIYAYSARQLLEMPSVQCELTRKQLLKLRRWVEADTATWKQFKPQTAAAAASRGSAAAPQPAAAAPKRRKGTTSSTAKASSGSPAGTDGGYGSEEERLPAPKLVQHNFEPGQLQ